MKTIAVILLGDLMLKSQLFKSEKARSKKVERVAQLLNAADVAFANVEVALCQGGHPKEKAVTLRGDPDLAKEVRGLGIHYLSLGNNHVLDFGFEGLFETIDALDRVKIRHVGAGRNLKEASRPLIIRVGGSKIGFLAYASTLPLGAAAGHNRPGINPIHIETSYLMEPARLQEQPGTPPRVRTVVYEEDKERVKKDIESLRQKADILFASVHWGVAFQNEIAQYQRSLSYFMIEEGIDVVYGHHTHCVQELEIYKEKLIFYSLGDFMFQYKGPLSEKMSPESIYVRCTINDKQIHEAEIIPGILNKKGDPQLAEGRDRARILERVLSLSPRLLDRFEIRDGRMFISCLTKKS